MKRELTIDTILIFWLLAAATAIVLFMAVANTPKVAAPTMQWAADTTWINWKTKI